MKTRHQVTAKYSIFILMTALLHWSDVFARDLTNIKFEAISSVKTYVSTIIQDSKGFIWAGTEIGLVRYDGYDVKVYQADPNNPYSLNNAIIQVIFEDRQGLIWVGTSGGLQKLDPETGRFHYFSHDNSNPNSIAYGVVRSIFEDSLGRLWVGMGLSGVSLYNPDTGLFTNYQYDANDPYSLSNNAVYAILEDQQGHIWLGTADGLNRFDANNKRFVRYPIHSKPFPNSKLFINHIYEDKDGRLWLSTNGQGLITFTPEQDDIVHYIHNPKDPTSIGSNIIYQTLKDTEEGLWVGTSGDGLNYFSYQSRKFKRLSFEINHIKNKIARVIYKDQTGVLWVGGEKLYKYDPYRFKFNSYQIVKSDAIEDIEENRVWAFAEDKDHNFWFGTGAGLFKGDGNGNIVAHYKHDNENAISSAILIDDSGVIWTTSSEGWFQKLDQSKKAYTRYQIPYDSENMSLNARPNIIQAEQGKIWISLYGGGLHLFDPKTETFEHFYYDPNDSNSLSSNQLYSLYKDKSGTLWIGTIGGGINKFDPGTRQFKRFRYDPTQNSLSNDNASSVYESQTGIYWMATDAGLDKYDPNTDTFINYNTSHGLATNIIYNVIEDNQGLVWLSYPQGITKFDPKAEIFTNYDERDGLLKEGGYFGGSQYKDSTGKLFFGGVSGYNVFHPEKLLQNQHPPPIVITDFQLFNKSIHVGDLYDNRILLDKPISSTKSIKLSYKDYVFSFGFAALNYSLTERNRYAYKMQGLEENWNYTSGRRFVTYTTLPSGDYTFLVKASNNDGVWNEAGASIKIVISPPYWQTWWFRTIIILLLITTTVSVYQLRLRSIRYRNKLLEKKVNDRTAKLKSKTEELEVQKKNLEETLLELNNTKDELIETAHKAGMADTATSVLHNVGNTLNSINVSAGIIVETLENSAHKRFIKANDLLKENEDNLEHFILENPKGKKLLNYYLNLEKVFLDENLKLKDNAIRLIEKANTIGDVIHAQKSLVNGVEKHSQLLHLREVVDEAIAFQFGVSDATDLKIKTQYDEIKQICAQKSKLTHILLNVFKNAADAMSSPDIKDKTLTIKINADQEHAYIRISDTGIGIEADKLETIFSFGYTSKANASGHGLHTCANYMSEMDGHIHAESAGLGKGAEFILSFRK